jgi:hypothetical protein
MAHPTAINIACIEACERIEARMYELTGLDLTPLPRNHRDNDILRKQQLETIADWLERVPEGDNGGDNRLTKALALLDSGTWTKAEMEDALTGQDNGDTDE